MKLSNFNFTKDTISIEFEGTYIDLHNLYDFRSIEYNVEKRTVKVYWQKGEGEYVPNKLPSTIIIKFEKVSLFAAKERDSEMPYSEDNCVHFIGFLAKDQWAVFDGFYSHEPTNENDHLIMSFMSGAAFKIEAEKASCSIL